MYDPYGRLSYPQSPLGPVMNNPYPQKQEIVRVNGENGAKAYALAPNSSVLLLDESAPIVWLKTTDGASYPTLTAYSITPYEKPQEVAAPDISALEERISKLERMMSNGKSNNTGFRQSSANTYSKSESTNRTDTTNGSNDEQR